MKLQGYDAAAKLKVIKEVRGFTALGLKEAKELVSPAQEPAIVKLAASYRCKMDGVGLQAQPHCCVWRPLWQGSARKVTGMARSLSIWSVSFLSKS